MMPPHSGGGPNETHAFKGKLLDTITIQIGVDTDTSLFTYRLPLTPGSFELSRFSVTSLESKGEISLTTQKAGAA